MAYKHLNFNQRCRISTFWKVGYLQKDIALEIGVSESTISRELKEKHPLEWCLLPRSSRLHL